MSSGTNVYFDGRSARMQRTTGWERYTRGLESALVARNWLPSPSPLVAESGVGRLLADIWFTPYAARHSTLVHYPTFPPVYDRRLPRRTLFTIHDLVWWKYPETATRVGRLWYRRNAERYLRTKRPVCTISNTVKSEIVEEWHYREDDVFVVPPGVEVAFNRTQSSPSSKPFFLTVATMEPRKNLKTLLNAWELSGCAESHELYIVGRVRDLLRTSIPRGVSFKHSLTDDQLHELYLTCTAFVLPSIYEGFGLPVAEALSGGAKVLCSDIPVFREVAGLNAIYFPATDVRLLAQTLAENRAALPVAEADALATAYRDRYTWSKAADAQIAAYERVLAY